jgi:hypothetical protein
MLIEIRACHGAVMNPLKREKKNIMIVSTDLVPTWQVNFHRKLNGPISNFDWFTDKRGMQTTGKVSSFWAPI